MRYSPAQRASRSITSATASDKVDAATKNLIMKVGEGKVTASICVTGILVLSDYAWIVVEKIGVLE